MTEGTRRAILQRVREAMEIIEEEPGFRLDAELRALYIVVRTVETALGGDRLGVMGQDFTRFCGGLAAAFPPDG